VNGSAQTDAGTRSQDETLAAYAQSRDAATANGFLLTLRTAALEAVSDPLLRYYARAATEPEQIRLVLGALGGTLPVEDVYSRGRIESTLA
jgi:hypothetical protein